MHNDQGSAPAGGGACSSRKRLAASRARRITFSVAGASGHRLLGGPFLRAAAGDELLHVWLAPKVTAPTAAARAELSGDSTSSVSSAAAGSVSGEAGADAERVIHRVGAYRLRVLSSEIITVGGAGDRNDPGTL